MGLMLSVLVACVGVAELLAFYANVRRSLTTVTTQTDLSEISTRYRQELGVKSQVKESNNNALECQKCKLEDIEVEFASRPIELARSRSKSPRLFLTENKSRSPSPGQRRLFIVSADENGDSSRPSTSKNIPTFVVEEKSDQFVISSQDESPLPLPSRFFVESTPSSEYFAELSRSRSPSPIPRRFVCDDAHRRSPSPYPPAVLPNAPRNSVCSELFDNKSISVVEVDEDALSKSPTPERASTSYGEENYSRGDRNLMVPKKNRHQRHKSESYSEIVILENGELFRRSASETPNKNNAEVDENEFDERFLNSLDGTSGRKINRHSASRKSIKARNKTSSGVEAVRDDIMSSPSCENNEIAKTLTEASNVLKSIHSDDESGSSSINKENEGHKPPEAFWVKK